MPMVDKSNYVLCKLFCTDTRLHHELSHAQKKMRQLSNMQEIRKSAVQKSHCIGPGGDVQTPRRNTTSCVPEGVKWIASLFFVVHKSEHPGDGRSGLVL